MGNSSNKKERQSQEDCVSQGFFSDVVCAGRTRASSSTTVVFRPWSRFSRRRWKNSTLHDALNSCKTAWPVFQYEAAFLPEFKIEAEPAVANYRFIGTIAKGSYGHVFKVQKRDDGKIYALKVLSKAQVVAEGGVKQAKQEVSTQKAVGHHPFIVNCPYHWQGRKKLYIVTEYVRGGELFNLVQEYGKLPEEVVRIYVAELALAIDFLHNAGIVHRDLKASNVLLDNEGHAMLIDFGFAKWLPLRHKTDTLCGTTMYIAPEVLNRDYYGHEVDWWSLGVLMCFLLTHQCMQYTVPLMEANQAGTNICVDEQDGTVPSPPQNPEMLSLSEITKCIGELLTEVHLSAAAKDLLKRLLEVDPDKRMRSLLSLQRVAFYKGCNFQEYRSRKVSPFELLGRPRLWDELPAQRQEHESSDLLDFKSGTSSQTSVLASQQTRSEELENNVVNLTSSVQEKS